VLELLTGLTVDLAQSAARHGEGLFETVRVVRGVPLRLPWHLQRMAAGARFLGLEEPPPAEAVLAFLEARGLCRGLDLGALRLLAVDGQLSASASPWAPRRPAVVSIGLSEVIVRHSASPLNRFKTLSYLENRILAGEAQRRGQFEVVARNEAGRLTDGGRTSLFLVLGGRLVTPAASAGALPGVARRALLEAGLAEEAELTAEDLRGAEAALLTNALQGGVPVHAVQGNGPLEAGHFLVREAVELLA